MRRCKIALRVPKLESYRGHRACRCSCPLGEAQRAPTAREFNHGKVFAVRQSYALGFALSPMKTRMGPCGIQLFERATGLNVLLDEVCVPAPLWARAPRHVSVALTNACDLSCPYCYAPKSPGTLELEKVEGWLKEMDLNGCLGVGFGGGEPTLYRNLAKLCRYTSQRTGLAVTLTTHAHRLDRTFIAALTGSVHFVRVSMDGVGPTYEALRGRSFASFRRQLEAVRSLAPFGINFVVNARTLPDLDAAMTLAAEVGADEFLLLPEQPSRKSTGMSEQTGSALRRWVELYRGSVPLATSEAGADGMPTCDPLEREGGLRAYAHIDAAGVLKRSSFDRAGVLINHDGMMHALRLLEAGQEGGVR